MHGQLGSGNTIPRNAPTQIISAPDTIPDDLPFTDVNIGDWFYDAVRYVFQNDIMRGISDTGFAPYHSLSRAMVATILHRMAGEPSVTFRPIFSDVAGGRWYSTAVTWAYDADIVQGLGHGRFAPDGQISREQLAVMMYRYAESLGYNFPAVIDPRIPEASAWAEHAMSWAVRNNFITADNPRSAATRAETAVFVYRFHLRFDL